MLAAPATTLRRLSVSPSLGYDAATEVSGGQGQEVIYAHSKRTLEFDDPATEAEFRLYYRDRFALKARRGLRNCLVLVSLVGIMELATRPYDQVQHGRARTSGVYAFFVLPSLASLLVPKRLFCQYQQQICGGLLMILAQIPAFAIWATNEGISFAAVVGLALIVMFGLTLRIRLNTFPFVAYGAIVPGSILLRVFSFDLTDRDAAFIVVILCGSTAMLLSSAYDIEWFVRAEFTTARRLQHQNERLRTRMQQRARKKSRRTALDLESPVEKIISMLEGLREHGGLNREGINVLETALDILSHSENLLAPEVQKQILNAEVGSDVGGGGGGGSGGGGAGGPRDSAMDHETTQWLMSEILHKKGSLAKRAPLPPLPPGTARRASDISDGNRSLGSFDIVEIPPEFDQVSFDAFHFAASVEAPLAAAATHIFKEIGPLLKRLKVNRSALMLFVRHVEGGYHAQNPYHTATHATDVLQGVWLLVRKAYPHLVDEDAETGGLDLFALLVAAIIHDYQHPGHSSTYEIESESELALTYNDRSVLENFHIASAWRLLLQDRFNFMTEWSRERRREFRQMLVDMVLATDISRHFEVLGTLNSKLASGGIKMDDARDRGFAMQVIIKMADISNPTRPFTVYEKWAQAVIEEFFAQGDKEREAGLPVSAFMDRYKTSLAKSQVGFISFVVLPLVESVVTISGVEELKSNIEANLAIWRDRQDQEDASQLGTVERRMSGKTVELPD